MEYKPFSKTGRKISAMGMGTYYDPFWVFVSFFGWKRASRQKVDALKEGLNGGISLIDTAEVYGSEPIVANAIRGYKRDELFIATKVSPNHLRRESVFKAFSKSLNRLQLSYVDLYQVHWPNLRIPISETMGAMEELLDQGKIMSVGVSNFSLQEMIEANAALGKAELASTQINYSLANRGIEKDILPYCLKEGISVFAYLPLAHGRLASKNSRIGTFAENYSKRLSGQPTTFLPSQIALNWLCSKQNVFPIPRASVSAHVKEDLSACEWRMTDEDLKKLEEMYPPP